MDSVGFLTAIEEKLTPISPVVKSVMERQLDEMGLSREMLSPRQAEMFIRRCHQALVLFIGPRNAENAKLIMMKELRKRAPNYFASQGL